MKGDAADFNIVLKMSLPQSISYFVHAHMLKNWGITKLGAHEYDESIAEMNHAEC
jgi:bacterioferritin